MMHFDDEYDWEIPFEKAEVFLEYAMTYVNQFSWGNLHNHEDKLFYYHMIQIIRKLEIPFGSKRTDLLTVSFKVDELLTINRFVKIIQIKIGEDEEYQEEREFFKHIAKQLFDLVV